MHRTHTCGELNINHVNTQVTLSGWVHRSRDLGGMTFIDLRDRYGITQLAFLPTGQAGNMEVCEQARKLGREFVVKATGKVMERSSKNANMLTGDIEIMVEKLEVLNASKTPPFTIENETDGGEELRMKYRYLDLRREVVRKNLQHRHEVAQATREYLSSVGFLEVETPVLIKSTPEGARDFVVPSRMNRGEFYALPQSPQTFKQLLMVGGFDKYFQIVKCFRDEDLRADRQPEFTQIDCEMSFVEQQDVLDTFEGMTKHLFKKVLNKDLEAVPHMTYADAMKYYGSDKPDIRFDMRFVEMNDLVKDTEFVVFKSVIDNGGKVIGINAKGCADYSRKQLDALTDFVKAPHRGMKGLVYVKFEADGIKSSAQKFFTDEQFKAWGEAFGAEEGDLLLILAGETNQTRKALNDLRLEMGNRLGLRDKTVFKPLWVVDFPLLEWDEDTQRFYAMHHPFTAPKPEDMHIIEAGDKSNFGEIRANAYDLVINGVEIGGGSIRIHDRGMQQTMFDLLGMSKEESEEQFGFIMQAFEYGAPPHGGLAFGFDRLCALLGGSEIIRDYIAFPKNNAGRDVMIDAPSKIDEAQLDELGIDLKPLED